MVKTEEPEHCSGYLRDPHSATPVLYLVYPDGRQKGLCKICATRWLLSDEEWPPKASALEIQGSRVTSNEIVT